MFFENNDFQLTEYFQPLNKIDRDEIYFIEQKYILIANSLKYYEFHDEVSKEIINKMQELDKNSEKYLFLNCDLINRLRLNKIKNIRNMINNNLDVSDIYAKVQDYEYKRDLKYSLRNDFIKAFCTQPDLQNDSNHTDSIDSSHFVNLSNDDFDFFNN